MESGSDDEFYDAAENLSFNRSKSHAATEDTKPPLPSVVTDDGRENNNTCIINSIQTTLLDDPLKPKQKKILTQNKTPVVHKTQNTIRTTSEKCTTSDSKVSHGDNENPSVQETLSGNTTVHEGTAIERHIFFDNANEQVTITAEQIPESPVGPAPIAPPRRKKKNKKNEEFKPRELTLANTSHNNLLPPCGVCDAKGAPCIEVMGSTLEMNQVLERGCSLDVVYNDDQIARKSGGIQPLEGSESESIPGQADQSNIAHLNLSSGRLLTDEEILNQVIIKNLDTGESIPLSQADDTIPECTNPLTLHIMRIATEHITDANIPADQGDDDGHLSDVSTASGGKMQGKRKKLKKFFGKTVQKIKSVADEVSQQVRKGEESSSSEDEQEEGDDGYIKYKNHRAKKDKLQFDHIKLLQDLSGEHIGAVWTMKFSLCGKLLATAGQDNIVRVWVLKDAASQFEEMRRKYSRPLGRTSPTGSMTSSNSTASADDELQIDLAHNADDDKSDGPFRPQPFVRYHGHTSDVLDLSWSKNSFLLSSSMDKTVRLWHISRQECLCCFQHVDFVTAICFHPRDDRYFLSGSLDGKIRLWNIPEKKVALWNEIDGYGTSLVTAANFCQNGKLAVVGTYDGRCIFFDTEKLKYHTQVTVRSSRGKNSRGRKVSGIEPMPGEDKVLITSNDSRIRLYDLKDHSLYCKYKGLQNESSQIRATFSHDGKLILCGSEDKYVYIWKINHDVQNVRKDRNEYYESFSAHDAVVTAAIFAPFPTAIIENPREDPKVAASNVTAAATGGSTAGPPSKDKPFEIIVAADWQGGVKLYINR